MTSSLRILLLCPEHHVVMFPVSRNGTCVPKGRTHIDNIGLHSHEGIKPTTTICTAPKHLLSDFREEPPCASAGFLVIAMVDLGTQSSNEKKQSKTAKLGGRRRNGQATIKWAWAWPWSRTRHGKADPSSHSFKLPTSCMGNSRSDSYEFRRGGCVPLPSRWAFRDENRLRQRDAHP